MLQLLALLALQDDAVELKWAAEKDDKFEIKWTYDEITTRVPGTGEKTEFNDKRIVDAEMTPKEEPGHFAVTLKKVSWIYSTNEFAISLAWAAGPKPPVATLKMKVDPKEPNAPAAKVLADSRVEQMKKLAGEGEYGLHFDTFSREARLTRNGSSARNHSIFDAAFLHSPLPNGTVTNGQTWKENLEHMRFPQLVEVKLMNCKVTFSGPGVSVKGGFTQPINRSSERGETTTGSFNFVREYTFSKEGCLLNSKEEQVFQKKVDAKGENADFYKENSSQTIKQAIAFKKAAAKKK